MAQELVASGRAQLAVMMVVMLDGFFPFHRLYKLLLT
jgi:hypothetical protein